MGDSSIEWTNKTWNPTRGCRRISPGCEHCYAETMAARFCGAGQPFDGLLQLGKQGPRWNGEGRFVPDKLDEPLHWRKPARVSRPWPLPNVWIGVSVEDQRRADERLPLLLRIPAAVRFVSYEPALGPVDFKSWLRKPWRCDGCGVPAGGLPPRKCAYCGLVEAVEHAPPEPGIDWLIVGGESGPGARPFELAWARSVVKQCKAAGVPVFVKQLGSRPIVHHASEWPGARFDVAEQHVKLLDRKGGDMTEWPADLRVREFPKVRPC